MVWFCNYQHIIYKAFYSLRSAEASVHARRWYYEQVVLNLGWIES